MARFCVDYRMACHPVTLKIGDSALGAWLRLGCWIATFPDKGDLIPESIATRYTNKRQRTKLVDAQLLIPVEGGYRLNKSMRLASSGLPDHSWMIDTSTTRRNIPANLRAAVYDRDGRQCVECGATEDLSLDHIWPYSLGGEDTLDNLRTLCRPCNSRKGARV